MSSNRFTKIAREVWDRIDEETGGRFDPEKYRTALKEEMRAHSADEELLDDYATKLAVAEEKKRTTAGVPGQLDLLTDEEADLDSFWRVGQHLIKVRRVVRDEFLKKLAQEDEDLARKQLAGAKRKREAAELLPFMQDAHTTLQEACAAWRRENPPSV